MVMVRRADPDSFQVLVFIEQLAIVGVDLGVGRFLSHFLDILPAAPIEIDFGHSDQVFSQAGVDAASCLPAGADGGHAQLLVTHITEGYTWCGHHRESGEEPRFGEGTAGNTVWLMMVCALPRDRLAHGGLLLKGFRIGWG